jgi:hypothetical protein
MIGVVFGQLASGWHLQRRGTRQRYHVNNYGWCQWACCFQALLLHVINVLQCNWMGGDAKKATEHPLLGIEEL